MCPPPTDGRTVEIFVTGPGASPALPALPKPLPALPKPLPAARCNPTRVEGTSWLMAQRVKNRAAVQEPRVQSLGGKIPWRRKWQPTAVFWPGESHGQRSLAGYSPWGPKSRTQLSD